MTITKRQIPAPEGIKPTGRFRSLMQAGARLAVAVAKRDKIRRSDDEREAALAICQGCEHWRGQTCGLCGCVGRWKTWLETEHCPKGKW
jgi:hypothetical protein